MTQTAEDEAGHGRGEDRPRPTASDQAHHAIEPDPRAAAKPASTAPGDVPPAIARRYFTEALVRGRLGFYADYNAPAPAFRDAGRRLSTADTNPNTIRDMVAVAEHRGWSAIALSGAIDFRREAWFEAQTRGLAVSGFVPGPRDRQELARRAEAGVRTLQSERATRGAGEAGAAGRDDAPARGLAPEVRGTLLEVGLAAYQGRPGARPTPFVKVRTTDGREVQVWGVALPAAVERSGAKPGDEVTLRREGTERVRPAGSARDVARTRWAVETERVRGASPDVAAPDEALRAVQAHLAVVAAVAKQRLGAVAGERVTGWARARAAAHLEHGRTFRAPPLTPVDRDRGIQPEREAPDQPRPGPERVRRR